MEIKSTIDMKGKEKSLFMSGNPSFGKLKEDPVVKIIAIPPQSAPESITAVGRYASQDTQLIGENEDIFIDNFI